MIAYFRATGKVFFRYRHLLKYLVQRDIRVKYRRSALGVVWSFLNPLMMMLIMSAVFGYMFRDSPIEYFPAYLLCGQVVFNFFSEATNLAMDSVLTNSALIKKVYIPKYIFPLEKVIFSLINTVASFATLIIVVIIMRVPLTPWVLLAPLPLILLFFFNLGVGMVLASVVIFFRDMKHLYGVLILALTYLTPIFYPFSADFLPVWVMNIIRLNPLYWYVTMMRMVVVYGEGPKLIHLVATAVLSLVAMLAGLFTFKKTQDRFILYI